MTKRRLLRPLLPLGAVALVALFAGSAAGHTLSSGPSSAGPARHCAIVGAPSINGNPSRIIRRGCFATRAKAGAFARGTTAKRTPARIALTFLIATDYQNSGQGGSSLDFYGTNGSYCVFGYSYQFVLNSPWNNMFSSEKIYNRVTTNLPTCEYATHYDQANFAGTPKINCRWSTRNCFSYIGDTMNDKSSSIWFRDSPG
jgi:hypothetical protein